MKNICCVCIWINHFFLFPSLSKVFFIAFSTNIILNTIIKHSTVIRKIVINVLVLSLNLIMIKNINIVEKNNIQPILHHNFPQISFANFHVSSFFIAIFVLYPQKLFLLMQFVRITHPAKTITRGVNKLHIKHIAQIIY